MTTLTVTQLASLPRVNLLPPEIEQRQRLAKIKTGLGAGVVAAVAAVGVLVVMANGAVGDAQDGLDAAKARETQLKQQQAAYAEVPQVYAQVEAAQAQLTQAMGKEVRWSYFLNDLSLRVPAKVWLTSLTVTEDVDGVAAAGSTAPATPAAGTYGVPGIGSVTFEGYGYQHNDVAAWLDALAKQKGLTQAYFTNSSTEKIGEEAAVKFSSQATLTDEALSKRYTPKAGS